jgi:protein phosphatase
MVADGMGGHLAGEVASGLVVETLSGYMKRLRDHGEEEEPEGADETLSPEANRLLTGIHLANWSVHRRSLENAEHRGMGSTLSAVYLAGSTAVAANVGDSPIYLIHGGSIEAIYKPHTLQAVRGAFLYGLLEREHLRHMLTQAMGVQETVEAHVCEVQCFNGDILVIGSDGLSDKVSPEEIRDVAMGNDPDEACRLLVDMANERGGDDNVTVVVVKMGPAGGRSNRMAGMLARFFSRLFRFGRAKG